MTFDEDLIIKKKRNAGLPVLTKFYQKRYNPMLDIICCEAHVITRLTALGFKVTKREIHYCFKKFHNKKYHGDVKTYCKYLYSLAQPNKKQAIGRVRDIKEPHQSTKIKKKRDC